MRQTNEETALNQAAYKKAHALITDESQSALAKYQSFVVGTKSLIYLLKYELITALAGGCPGALGLVLRKKGYPLLLRSCGKGVVFGAGVRLRNACKVDMGNQVVVADDVTLDARGEASQGIVLGDNVILGQRAMLLCKEGDIRLGRNVGIGGSASLYAVGGNVITLEDDVMVAPYAYIGLTQYHHDRIDIPMLQQGHDVKGGVHIGKGAWIGAKVMIMDGVRVGRDAIIAAGAVVTKDVPDYAIVAGVPGRVLRDRRE